MQEKAFCFLNKKKKILNAFHLDPLFYNTVVSNSPHILLKF